MSVDFVRQSPRMGGLAMSMDWNLFVPGLLLLLLPADLFLSARVELRSFESFRTLHDSPRQRPWWWVPILWLDPLRGFTGVVLVRRALDLEARKWEFLPRAPYAWLVALLVLAVVAQLCTRRDRETLLAPLGFVAGLATALTPLPVIVPAFLLACVALFGLRHYQAFFGVGAAMLVALGFAFRVEPAWFLPAAIAFVLPVIASLVTDRALALPTRGVEAARRPSQPLI